MYIAATQLAIMHSWLLDLGERLHSHHHHIIGHRLLHNVVDKNALSKPLAMGQGNDCSLLQPCMIHRIF